MESTKETGCQAAPEGPILCINNCGFFGSAATMNMCSKCHKEMILKQEHAKLAASSFENIVNGGGGGGSGSENVDAIKAAQSAGAAVELKMVPMQARADDASSSQEVVEAAKVKPGPTRCSACRKRVGLTGFNCRCGNLFCSAHRYSDKHECPFDYRTAGRDAIAKANPVVKAEKLDKI